ncbi:hypothetical protein [Aureispira sp. CCB-QB1]|uniref:DUF7793 family protein n=1 Tax=Aureispira sp. CCB-QB1 TaxID=1313421 RepID=UPI00069885D6|nr:hypothetical protein [Aureispira sp. CCB-QB1]
MIEYKTRAMTFILREDDIVELVNNQDWKESDTLEIAVENMMMVKKAIDGKSRGFLVNVPNRYVSKELLHYYQNVEVGDVARALILNSFAAKIVGNLYFKLSGGKPNETGRIVPTKLFNNRKQAIEWLLDEIEKCGEGLIQQNEKQ